MRTERSPHDHGELFAREPAAEEADKREEFAEDAVLLRGAALHSAAAILAALDDIVGRSPFRNMTTPGGFEMSVAMTNCGDYGWITDRSGYRYSATDPLCGKPWPAIPPALRECAMEAAANSGFGGFAPDACLVNRYEPGARLSLHQDKDERDFSQPVVSISLGAPAVFLFGGLRRNDRTQRIALQHGDVVVWGGASRLRYHGVLALKASAHPLLGPQRINLTLRKSQ